MHIVLYESLPQDWQWNPHGGWVPMRGWERRRAKRYTDWASEVLSGPLDPDDLVTTIATRQRLGSGTCTDVEYFSFLLMLLPQELQVTHEDVKWAKRMARAEDRKL